MIGAAEPPAWNRPARTADIDDVKGAIDLVCRRLGFGAPSFAPLTTEPLLYAGRAATVVATGTVRDDRAGTGLSGVVDKQHLTLVEQVELQSGRLIVA